MTSTNLYVTANAAILQSDRAILDPVGCLQSTERKIVSNRRLQTAFVTSGLRPNDFAKRAEGFFEAQSDQESMMNSMSEFFRTLNDFIRSNAVGTHETQWRAERATTSVLAVATWSIVRNQPEAYVMTAGEELGDTSVVPFQFYGVRSYIAPVVRAPSINLQAFDPNVQGRQILEQQREGYTDKNGRCIVGGGFDTAIVSARGVDVSGQDAWADTCGFPLSGAP